MINKTDTAKITVSSVAANLATNAQPRVMRVYSDRAIHVLVGAGVTATPDNAMPISVAQAETFAVAAHAVMSIIVASGEISGSAWITEL